MNQNFGYLIIFLSTVFYAVLTPLLKKTSDKIPPFTIMAISMAVLFLCSLLLSIFVEHSLTLKLGTMKPYILILIVVGLINTVAFWLGIEGYKYLPCGNI